MFGIQKGAGSIDNSKLDVLLEDKSIKELLVEAQWAVKRMEAITNRGINAQYYAERLLDMDIGECKLETVLKLYEKIMNILVEFNKAE